MMNAYHWHQHLDPSPYPFPPLSGYARCGRQHDRHGRHIAAHAAPRVPLATRAARAAVRGASRAASWLLYPEYVVYKRLHAA